MGDGGDNDVDDGNDGDNDLDKHEGDEYDDKKWQ